MRVDRERLDAANRRVDRLGDPSEDEPSVLVETVAVSSYPSAASSFFGVRPLAVDGPESEGAAATFTPDPARTFYAYNLGTQVPPIGTMLIAHDGGGRWAFRYDG